MGQLSDPFGQGEEEDVSFTLSLPGEPHEPDDPPGGPDGSEPAEEPEAATDDEDGAEVTFDLGHWSDIERDVATDRLREGGVPHWWVGGELHVAAADEEAATDVLESVEGERREPLDPDRDQVAYDMSEWEDGRLAVLEDRLDAEGIAFEWDGDELFVYAEDEDGTDEIVDAVSHPDALVAEADEVGSDNLLGDLFLLADRLQRDLDDHEAVVSYAELAEGIEDSEPPYGLAARDWEHLRERVTVLADLLEADSAKDEELVAAAADLRNSLRPYV